MMSNTIRTGRGMGMLAAIACGAGVAWGQIGVKVPTFEIPLVFDAPVIFPYGIASADFLDENGNPGQDGFPEIVVAGAGVDLYAQELLCEDVADTHSIEIFHNKGATVRWDGTDGPDPDSDPDDPHDALVSHQTINLPNGVWTMELTLADVTGINGVDLLVLAQDPDLGKGYLQVYKNLGNGDFDPTPAVTETTAVSLRGLVTADLDGDGDIDIAAAGSEWDCASSVRDLVVVFRNDTPPFGNLLFAVSLVQLDIAGNTAPGDIVVADFYSLSPGDSFPDLLTPNPGASSYTAIRNLGNLQFDPTTWDRPVNCTEVSDWDFVTAAGDRFGADLTWDFVAVDPDELYAGIFLGDGSGGFVSACENAALGYQLAQPALEGEIMAYGVDTGHLNGAHYPDVVVVLVDLANFTQGPDWDEVVAVLLGKADGTFKTESPDHAYLFNTDPEDGVTYVEASILVEVVDLDGDGFDDIVVTNHRSENITVLRNTMLVVGQPGGL